MVSPVTSGTRSAASATAGMPCVARVPVDSATGAVSAAGLVKPAGAVSGAVVVLVRSMARVIGASSAVRGTPARGPRLPVARRDRPGLHPGHPTAVGGLPASKPGLRAGTHDLSQKVTENAAGGQPPPHILRRRSHTVTAQ